MFGLIGGILGSIAIGFCISCVLIGIMLFLIKSMYPTYFFEIKGVCISFCMFILVFIQSVLLLGANQAKEYLGGIEKVAIIENLEVSGVKQKIQDEYPVLEKFISTIPETALDLSTDNVTFSSLIRYKINLYMYKRIGWLVVFVLIGGAGLNYVARNNSLRKNSNTRKRSISGVEDSL